MAMDVGNSIKLAQRVAASVIAGQVITVADGDNEVALTVNQNDVTNNPDAVVISNTGTGNSLEINSTDFIVDSSGNVTIAGDLTVNGTTTTINTVTWTVDDNNIELGSVAVPDDTTADGGGITLKGATDKTIIWDNANDNWTFNQAVNVESGLSYKINNVDINTGGTLSNVAYLDQSNTFTNNQLISNAGNNTNSYKISLVSNAGGVSQTGSIQTLYGADPYIRISAPNDSGAETAVIDIHDTAITFSTDNTVDIGSSGANRPKNLYMSGDIDIVGSYKIGTANINTGGTLSNVAYLDQNNSFTDGQAITVADTVNTVGLTITQNDTTNNPDAVVITNTGTGNSLEVNTDDFLITSSGVVNIGGGSSSEARVGQLLEIHTIANYGGISQTAWANTNTSSPVLDFNKSRSETPGSHSLVSNGDNIGTIYFRGDDGGDFRIAAMIRAQVDGVAANIDMPGRLMFYTTPDASINPIENMRIAEDGGIFFQNLGTLSGKSDVQYDTSTKELGYVSSSIRYKDNIRTDIDTDWLYNIDVKMYDRIDKSRINEVGLIAEDLAQLKPDLCAYNELGQVETYSNLGIVPYLLKEIQNLKEEIESLKNN